MTPLPIDPRAAQLQANLAARMRQARLATDWIALAEAHLATGPAWRTLTAVAEAIGCSTGYLRKQIKRDQNRLVLYIRRPHQFVARADRQSEPRPERTVQGRRIVYTVPAPVGASA